uniref:Uncharacterized protein n=1 Tax=Compsopogon caeruleus TaxID=31354 RepID=A0A7S1T5Q0_9RHOD|mmetsp:Transcript_11220/g.22353  ORF Transcript_11220/g.22353 Transcript_11220/m.22353 type:complete len:221 (+) Transcript_11220:104-766(+)
MPASLFIIVLDLRMPQNDPKLSEAEDCPGKAPSALFLKFLQRFAITSASPSTQPLAPVRDSPPEIEQNSERIAEIEPVVLEPIRNQDAVAAASHTQKKTDRLEAERGATPSSGGPRKRRREDTAPSLTPEVPAGDEVCQDKTEDTPEKSPTSGPLDASLIQQQVVDPVKEQQRLRKVREKSFQQRQRAKRRLQHLEESNEELNSRVRALEQQNARLKKYI